MRFLLIDDNPIDLLVAEKALSNLLPQAVVEKIRSAPEALAWLEINQSDLPDLIFLDIRMPVMDGFRFLEIVAEKYPALCRDRRIVMLSSSIDPGDIARSRSNPAVRDFLEKPLRPSMLEQLLSLPH